MTTQPIRQQSYSGYRPLLAILLMVIGLLTVQTMIRGIDQTNEAGVSGGHANHEDTLTTPLSGNCPCGYSDCGGCGGTIAITLEPTIIITALPTFYDPPTPDIPDPINNATTFPTLQIPATGQAPATMMIPTLVPTVEPETIPTLTSLIPDRDPDHNNLPGP